jgi:hypothetical protein
VELSWYRENQQVEDDQAPVRVCFDRIAIPLMAKSPLARGGSRAIPGDPKTWQNRFTNEQDD